MGGYTSPSKEELDKAAQEEGNRIFKEVGMTGNIMKELKNRNLLIPLQMTAGYQSDKQKKKRLPKKNADDNTQEQCRLEWLKDRALSKLKDPKDLSNDQQLRNELIKWIDAKRFFHYLIHGHSSASTNIGLDDIWKNAFSSETPPKETPREDKFYRRFFNSLTPNDPSKRPEDFSKWPEDFKLFLEKFQEFLCPK
jgi:hypothetical protein